MANLPADHGEKATNAMIYERGILVDAMLDSVGDALIEGCRFYGFTCAASLFIGFKQLF
jgi:hypothetical protein